jgi:hypothetical protein
MSKVSRHSQETFIFACEIVENFRHAYRESFGAEKSENAMNE